MSDNPKTWRRDQDLVNNTTSEIREEVDQDSTPHYENPNRDRARGDWDRTRRRDDGDFDTGNK